MRMQRPLVNTEDSNTLLSGLRERINNGDETPSILGNIMRSNSLSEEEILLVSYTGSSCCILHVITYAATYDLFVSCFWSEVGYSLTWIIGLHC